MVVATPNSRRLIGLRGTGGRLFDALAPGLYAWGVTVGWPVSHRFAPLASRIFALVALVSLVSGAALLFSAPRLARAFGIWIFLAACIGAWAMFSPAFSPRTLDPVQGVLGAIGWAFFAISWASDPAAPNAPPSPTVAAEPTRGAGPDRASGRQALPKGAAAALFFIAILAAIPMFLAWSVQTLERALIAHVVSLAAGIALVSIMADRFEPRSRAEQAGFDASRKPERRITAALPAIVALTALAVAGAAYTLLR
jgi:hypothetical protein